MVSTHNAQAKQRTPVISHEQSHAPFYYSDVFDCHTMPGAGVTCQGMCSIVYIGLRRPIILNLTGGESTICSQRV